MLIQDYEEYEIIVVDDGSKDETSAICDWYEKKYKAVQVIHSENKGVSSARNLGLEKAMGDYILFLDADDQLVSDALNTLAAHTANAEWIIGNYFLVEEEKNRRIAHQMYFNEGVHEGKWNELPELASNRLFHFIWGKLYDRHIIQQFQLRFNENMSYGEDILFNTYYYTHIKHFVALNTAVYAYSCHLTTGLSNQPQLDEWKTQKRICQEMQRVLQKEDEMSADIKARMNHFYYAQCIASVERAVCEGNKQEVKRICHSRFFRELLEKEKIVAVGEIGLDYYWDKEGHDLQKHWFIRQLDLAREMNKPVMIHSREAAADTMEIMKEHGKGLKGVIHCYSYSLEMAREYVKMGYYIGVGGVVTFKNSKKLKEIVEEIPLESIVLETDCPYLAPTPFRGKRNSSLYLPYVVEAIAELKGISAEQVIEQTEKNARDLYQL